MTRKLQLTGAAAAALTGGLVLGSMAGSEPPASPPEGVILELYDGTDFKDSKCTVKSDVPDLGKVRSDDARIDFENKTASVKWNIPVGWQAVLCEEPDYKGNRHELKGTGRLESTGDLGCFNDRSSSIRWEKTS